MSVTIRTGTIEEVLMIQRQIPELKNGYGTQEYKNRLLGVESLILIAEVNDVPVGFKIGYDRYLDGEVFYSWMGGVIDAFREQGVAHQLLQKMEVWCKIKGYDRLKFKTQNKHRGMLQFAVRHGFDVVDFESKADPAESRIYFEKKL